MYPLQAHAHKHVHKYINTYSQPHHSTVTLNTRMNPQARSASSSVALAHSPALSPATGPEVGRVSVTGCPTPGSGTWFCRVTSTQTCAHSSRWHCGHTDLCPGSDSSCWPHRQTHRTGALQPGKELGVEFSKTGQTVPVRSKAWPDKRVTFLHSSSLFYPLVPLFPCNTSQNAIPLHLILCSMPQAASPLNPKRDPAVFHLDGSHGWMIHLDSSPGTALAGLRQAVLLSESLIWAPLCLQDPVLPSLVEMGL